MIFIEIDVLILLLKNIYTQNSSIKNPQVEKTRFRKLKALFTLYTKNFKALNKAEKDIKINQNNKS